MPATTARWTNLKNELAERRAERRAMRTLRHDLSVFTTPEQIEDLLAAAERQVGDEDDVVIRALRDRLVEARMATAGQYRWTA